MRPTPPLPITLRAVNHTLVRHYRCEANWKCHLVLKDFDLWYVVSGVGTLLINGQRLEIHGPQVCVFCPGDVVLGEHQSSSPLDVFAFHFLTHESVALSRQALSQLQGMRPKSTPQVHELCNLLVDSSSHEDELGMQQRKYIGGSLLTLLWRDFHAQTETENDWRIQSLTTQIRRRPEYEWSLEGMARIAGLSRSYLTKQFRRLTGLSPQQFVIRTRVQHACTLMAETHLSLAQIAEASGYRDVYFFSRQFKTITGNAPAAFRRKQAAKTVFVDR